MSSLIYNSFLDDLAHAAFDLDAVTVKAMLVSASYAENKDTHTKRSDITNEVAGTGYTAGGVACAVSIAKDTTNDRVVITLGAVSWPTATITARKCLYYISRGGVASADELIVCNDFGADVSASGGTFSIAASTITLQN